jgi:hypothetical protein
MDTIFANLNMGGNDQRTRSDDDEFIDNYEAKVKALIADAVDFDRSDLSPERERNLKYYHGISPGLDDMPSPEVYGDPDPDEKVNRSQAISTDVRDAVMSIMPSLIRIFSSSENIVNFVPSGPEQDEMAKQATDDVIYTFWDDNPGFLILHDVFKDALTQKAGIVRWWTDDNKSSKEREYINISVPALQNLVNELNEGHADPQVEILEMSQPDEQGIIANARIKWIESKPLHRVETVAPEDFRIDRRAKRTNSARLIGSASIVPGSDLVAMGYSKELIDQYTGSYDYYAVEKQLRTPGIDTGVVDRDLVEYGEYFIRIDKDGDGIDELHYICTIGDNYDVIKDEIVDDIQLAVFCGDPEPHTVIGSALADLVIDIQQIKTQLLRGALDSLSGSLFPDIAVNETLVNMDDMLSDGVGRVLRTKGDPNSTMREFRPTWAGAQAFEMMGTMDMIRQSRTGISEASKGVDPKALQSTNLMGIDAIVTGAQERIELIARILAETGFKDMMRGLLREIVRAPNRKRTIKMRGKWVEMDQSTFDPNLTTKVNPSLGKGSDMAKIQALQQIQQTQTQIITQMGITNPVVTPEQYLNTVKDMLAIVNIKDTSRYFTDITPEMVQQLNAPKEPTPEEMIAKAEIEKIKKDMAVATADQAFKRQKLAADDDFRRDQLGLTSLVDLVKSLSEAADGSLLEAQSIIAAENQPG